MSEITTITHIGLKPMMEKLSYYKHNPAAIQDTVLNYLKAVTNGVVDIVDPTNPFVFLLEASCVLTASAIYENERYLRQQYPSLAINEEELYIHLSDRDIVNRFAKPSKTQFDFLILKSDLDSKMVRDDSINGYRITIPRNTQIKISNTIFSLEYPVHILKLYHGGLQIAYDLSSQSELLEIKNNIVPYTVNRDNALSEWIKFTLDAVQVESFTTQIPISNSVYFNNTVPFNDQFVKARIYFRTTGKIWTEIATTLTEQVFDITKPTTILKVTDGNLTVSIPKIYLSNNIISGIIRIDIFTSKGLISVNTANYKLDAFETDFKALDAENDLSIYTSNISSLALLTSSDRLITGGESALSFKELKDRLVFNSLSGNRLPITNIQLSGYLADLGFNVILNTDIVTNRIFIATKPMPVPLDNTMLSPMDAVIITFVDNLDSIRASSQVFDNIDQVTIISNTVFKSENKMLRMLDSVEVKALQDMEINLKMDLLNSDDYYFTPFYYVLDTSQNEFECRVYHLDKPKAYSLNFVSNNNTVPYFVNVGNYELIRTENGYKLIVVTVSDNEFKKLNQDNCGAVLSFKAMNEKDLSFIESKYLGLTKEKELIFEFEFISTLKIDSENNINFTNLTMYQNTLSELSCSLTLNANLVFYTTQTNNTAIINSYIESFLPNYESTTSYFGVSLYNLDLLFGNECKTLWKQARSYLTEATYRRYETDVYLTYDDDIYEIDPITGSIFKISENNSVNCTILHNKGELALDALGEPVIKYHKGDVIFDHKNKPIPVNNSHLFRSVDIFLLDAKYFYATDTASRNYLELTVETVFEWVYTQLKNVTDILLEQTKIFFKPTNSRGLIKVNNQNNKLVDILAQQELTINYYVNDEVYNNINLRNMIYYTTIERINEHFTNKLISISELTRKLQEEFSSEVLALEIKGLAGENNYSTLSIIDDNDRLNIAKKIFRLSDGSLAVREQININYILLNK